MFTAVPVESPGTLAAARHPVTRPVILTPAVQLAVYPVSSRGTLSLAVRPGPAQSTGAGTSRWITPPSVLTGTGQQAGFPEAALLTASFTASARLPGWTRAVSCHMIMARPVSAGRHLSAVLPVVTSGACGIAVCSDVARRALTGASGGLAVTPVQTLTRSLTVRAIQSIWAFQLAVVAMVAWRAVACPGHRVALLVLH